MTKRTRTVIFVLFAATFTVLAPALLLYSQGYRVDWTERKFSKVGAFYFSVTPTRAEILVNEKSIGKTARVFGTVLTKNFPPSSYYVRIQKEGYHAWEKRLEVLPKQVTEAKHVTLIATEPEFAVLQKGVIAFWFAPNANEVLLQKSKRVGEASSWNLVLWDTRENIEYLLYESPRPGDRIESVQWAQDSDSFSFTIESEGSPRRSTQQIERALLARQNTAAEQLQVATRLRTPYVSPPQEQEAIAFLEKGQKALWLDQRGFLWLQENRENQAVQINQKEFFLEPEAIPALFVFGTEFFVQAQETLYRYTPQTQAFEQFFTPFQEIAQSPDGRALALRNQKEIWLHFLRDDKEQPLRAKDERVFLTRFSQDIGNLIWFTSHYLLFTRGDAIMISEIDTRDRLNAVELASFSKPVIFWQDATKTLFVHTENQLLASQKLLP